MYGVPTEQRRYSGDRFETLTSRAFHFGFSSHGFSSNDVGGPESRGEFCSAENMDESTLLATQPSREDGNREDRAFASIPRERGVRRCALFRGDYTLPPDGYTRWRI